MGMRFAKNFQLPVVISFIMVFVESNGGYNGSLVEVASCSNTSNGGRMSRVYSRMTF